MTSVRCLLCWSTFLTESSPNNDEATTCNEETAGVNRNAIQRGLHYILQNLNAENIWSALLPELDEQKFCTVCINMIKDVHQLLFDIEVLELQLDGKVADAKDRILLSSVDEESQGMISKQLAKTWKLSKKIFSKAKNVTLPMCPAIKLSRLDEDPPNPKEESRPGLQLHSIEDKTSFFESLLELMDSPPEPVELEIDQDTVDVDEQHDELVIDLPPSPTMELPETPLVNEENLRRRKQDISVLRNFNKNTGLLSIHNDKRLQKCHFRTSVNGVPFLEPRNPISTINKPTTTVSSLIIQKPIVIKKATTMLTSIITKPTTIATSLPQAKNNSIPFQFQLANMPIIRNQTSSNLGIQIQVLKPQPLSNMVLTHYPKQNEGEQLNEKDAILSMPININCEGKIAIPQGIYQCDHCHQIFVTKLQIIEHYKQIHAGANRFHCSVSSCHREFLLSHDLILHTWRDHKKVISANDANLQQVPATSPTNQETPVTQSSVEVMSNQSTTFTASPRDMEKIKRSLEIVTNAKKYHLEKNRWFKCEVCTDMSFTSQQRLDIHIASNFHKMRETLWCCKCKTKCSNEFEWQAHEFLHSTEPPPKVSCRVCGLLFEKDKLNDHIESHDIADRYYKCKECGKLLKSKRCLRHHVNGVHLKKPRIKYSYSRKKTPSKNTTSDTIMCEICGRTFLRNSLLKQHMKYHDGSNKIKCPQCPKIICKTSLQTHLKTHSTKAIPCKICNKIFFHENSLKNHVKRNWCYRRLGKAKPPSSELSDGQVNEQKKSSHNESEPVINPTLDDIDMQLFDLATPQPAQKHIKHTKSETEYFCRLCKEPHFTEVAIQNHFEDCHPGQKPFVCSKDNCPTTASKRSDIRKHIIRVHGTPEEQEKHRKFACHLCDRRLYSKESMRQHVRTHVNYRPFPCPEGDCKLSFGTTKTLNEHILSFHENYRPHKCSFCEKSYPIHGRGMLLQHEIRCHTGKFKCHICEVKRATQEELDKHFEIHKKRCEWIAPEKGENVNELQTFSEQELPDLD